MARKPEDAGAAHRLFDHLNVPLGAVNIGLGSDSKLMVFMRINNTIPKKNRINEFEGHPVEYIVTGAITAGPARDPIK